MDDESFSEKRVRLLGGGLVPVAVDIVLCSLSRSISTALAKQASAGWCIKQKLKNYIYYCSKRNNRNSQYFPKSKKCYSYYFNFKTEL